MSSSFRPHKSRSHPWLGLTLVWLAESKMGRLKSVEFPFRRPFRPCHPYLLPCSSAPFVPLFFVNRVVWPFSSVPRWLRIPCSVLTISANPTISGVVVNPYPGNDLLNAFLVRFHLQECSDLGKGQVLSVTQSNDFIKCTEQVKGILQNLPLVQGLANAGDELSEQMKRVDILKDVGLFIRNQDHIQLVEWLVNIADVVGFDTGNSERCGLAIVAIQR